MKPERQPRIYFFLLLTTLTPKVWSCATLGAVKASRAEIKSTGKIISKERKQANKRKLAQTEMAGPMPLLPDNSSKLAWGGAIPDKQRSEALLANATARALNSGWRIPDVQDVIVSVPVRMKFSDERPYGDGQTNASASLGDWSSSSVPLVASLIHFNKKPSEVHFALEKKLIEEIRKLEIIYFEQDKQDSKKFSQKAVEISLNENPEDKKSVTGVWLTPNNLRWGDLEGARAAFVRPLGWSDWFPIDFRHPIVKETELRQDLGNLKMSGERSMLDPAKIREEAIENQKNAFEVLIERSQKSTLGDGFNQLPYLPKNIHAWFPEKGNLSFTAVGKGWTWVVGENKDRKHSPFKNLYTCFERRQAANEAEDLTKVVEEAMKDSEQKESRAGRRIVGEKNVTSGGGWHEIGDAAETIINNLEPEPIVVGMATGLPWPQPPSGKYSYNLTDVATIRWLQPGEALITPAGAQTLKENRQGANQSESGGRNYHWFLFHHNREVCTQEFVHNCSPTYNNSFGLKCL